MKFQIRGDRLLPFRRTGLISTLTILGTAIAVASSIVGFGQVALGAPGQPASSGRQKILPAHLSAPYVDVTSVADLNQVSEESRARYLTLAFLQTDKPGSCRLYWAGDTKTAVASAAYGRQIAAIQRRGGDVVPSFGGYAADTTNTEIADSCTDVHKIARAYQEVITRYHVRRLDFDIEADSVTDQAGIDRRNKAIHEVQDWAARTGREASFSYTLPATPQGLVPSGLAVLSSAARNGAHIAMVNILTFDYYDGLTHNMNTDAQSAATALVGQLRATIAPHASPGELWSRVGATQMIGIDDFGPQETFTLADAHQFVAWAKRKNLGLISFWALQRDNGACPGQKGANSCSGISQSTWAFSHEFMAFH